MLFPQVAFQASRTVVQVCKLAYGRLATAKPPIRLPTPAVQPGRSWFLIALVAAPALMLCLGVEKLSAQTVSVWITTDDQSRLLQPQSALSFSQGASQTNCVRIDTSVLYQQIEGFGAAFTDTTGYVLNQLATPVARTNAMLKLFTRAGGGIGLSFMRVPMGASDLARFHYSYDDLPAGQTDPNLFNFSIAHDEQDLIPLIQQARSLNPDFKLMANPWSPPGWMKTSGSMIGGTLLDTMYRPFANYFVRFIQEYQRHGIPVDYISLQNEPLYVPGDYPGMGMDASTQALLLRDYVLPALATNGLPTKVLVFDHNWSEPNYPDTVLSDATLRASTQIAGVAWHGYGGTPGAMLELADKFPTKGNYQTEHSGGQWVSNQVRTDFHEIIHVMRSWGKAFVKWNLAGDQNDGPHAGGCATCTPLAIVNPATGFVSYSVDFYTLGHFSKFVLPGAWRVYSANAPGLVTVAFLNPDLSKVLVAFNDTSSSNTFQVQWGDRVFNYSLPAYSGATFLWSGETGTESYHLSAAGQLMASGFHDSNGLRTEGCEDTQGGFDLGFAENGDYALYRDVDFGAGITGISARVASAGGGSVEFRVNGPTGPLLGSLTIPVTGGWQTWQSISGPAAGAKGVKNLYVVFKGGSGIGNINWFRFKPVPGLSQPVYTNGVFGFVLQREAGAVVQVSPDLVRWSGVYTSPPSITPMWWGEQNETVGGKFYRAITP